MKYIYTICLFCFFSMSAYSDEQHGKTERVKVANVVSHFYKKLDAVGMRGPGVFREENIQPFLPLFTQSLKLEFLFAQNQIEIYQRRNDGQKIPFTEGCVFTSAYENPTGFKIGSPTIINNVARVPIRFYYQEGKEIFRWIDIVILHKGDNGWKIDNILFNYDSCNGTSDGSLRSEILMPLANGETNHKSNEVGQPAKPVKR